MTSEPSGGLMQALAPITTRRPVHLIVSAAEDGDLHVVCQPVRASNDEEPELAQGFTVTASPAELDQDLPGLVANTWVPARESLQRVLDQVAAAAEQKRQAVMKKPPKGGRATDAPSPASAQISLDPPPAGPPASSPRVPAPSDAAAEEGDQPAQPADTAAPPATPEPVLVAAGAPAPAGDEISAMFD
ncbi:PRTRC system protein E [Longimicrobium terrae]|uniref:PRTRC genetic system protein E n=1 Tax=Longimicrobium terrae TaxID=1639882 RepID=A0A841GWV7_9BACT|nr:PRTRC system protein E [Longimicrobium terrae]MBB4635957.1 PRTRC genetic system protein E [Longimicrobium terrae]MBB6070353.1 PRTRC genetic system protein E [Longimicrobium terrae]NNC30850.1 PRTRC system protein E [Longimicrobium terrae]